jgi:hypothetical protein
LRQTSALTTLIAALSAIAAVRPGFAFGAGAAFGPDGGDAGFASEAGVGVGGGELDAGGGVCAVSLGRVDDGASGPPLGRSNQ